MSEWVAYPGCSSDKKEDKTQGNDDQDDENQNHVSWEETESSWD